MFCDGLLWNVIIVVVEIGHERLGESRLHTSKAHEIHQQPSATDSTTRCGTCECAVIERSSLPSLASSLPPLPRHSMLLQSNERLHDRYAVCLMIFLQHRCSIVSPSVGSSNGRTNSDPHSACSTAENERMMKSDCKPDGEAIPFFSNERISAVDATALPSLHQTRQRGVGRKRSDEGKLNNSLPLPCEVHDEHR